VPSVSATSRYGGGSNGGGGNGANGDNGRSD
jgi:hypothetical protein